MALDTVILQGRFTSDGAPRIISLRSDVDWMRVYNFTQASAQNNVGVEYYWQRGFADGTGLRYFKSGGVDTLNVLNLASPLGFTLTNTSANPVGAAVATTASTNAVQPVVSTGSTAGLVTGTIVRLSNVAATPNIMGVDFEIDTIVANVSFRIRRALATAPGAAGGAGFYRVINFDPIYYPRRRFIASITQAASAVITTTVQHQYTVGQQVRFQVPAQFGMIQMNNLLGTITATTVATITVNINSSAFTAYVFPVAAGFTAVTFAQVVPVGEDTAQAILSAVDMLDDSTTNLSILGINLAGGADSPGGNSADQMYWVAGRSFSVDNQ